MTAVPAAEKKKLITEAELILMNQEGRFEIIDGEPVETTMMGKLQVVTAANLFRLLDAIVTRQKLGYLFPDGLIYLMWMQGRGIKGALIPDVSFIRKDNILKKWEAGNYPGAPDLAVEVVSAGDDAEKVLNKVRSYLDRGTEEVWVIYPETARELHQYRKDQRSIEVFHEGDTLDASAFFPDVSIVIADLFKLPELD
jgi:Uma2 family endonuclease